MKKIKRRAMYALAIFRRFARTPKGERIIVTTLTIMTIILVLDCLLLLFGLIF